MKHLKRLIMAFAVASLGTVSSASGATIVFDGTTIMGVQGLEVGGTLYDVTFVDGVCADIFSGCDVPADDFAFTDPIAALGAGSSLLILFNTRAPDTTFGCTDPNICHLLIPYGLGHLFGNPVVFVALASNNINNHFDFVDVGLGGTPPGIALSGDTSLAGAGDELVWAQFRPAAAAVPEPATLALLATGLAAAGRRWRHARRGGRQPRALASSH